MHASYLITLAIGLPLISAGAILAASTSATVVSTAAVDNGTAAAAFIGLADQCTAANDVSKSPPVTDQTSVLGTAQGVGASQEANVKSTVALFCNLDGNHPCSSDSVLAQSKAMDAIEAKCGVNVGWFYVENGLYSWGYNEKDSTSVQEWCKGMLPLSVTLASATTVAASTSTTAVASGSAGLGRRF